MVNRFEQVLQDIANITVSINPWLSTIVSVAQRCGNEPQDAFQKGSALMSETNAMIARIEGNPELMAILSLKRFRRILGKHMRFVHSMLAVVHRLTISSVFNSLEIV